MGLILLSVFAFDKDTPFPSLYALAPVAGTALVILYGTQGTLVANLLSARPFLGIGLISYSAYLWHQPLFAFARLRSVDHPNIYLMLALSLVALLLAWLTWRFVERPFRTKSTSLSDRRRIFLASGAGGALFIAIGVYGHHADGNILNKHDPRAVALFDRIQSENATWRNKHRLRLQDFPDDGDRNLLVIGDSQSGDLLNALLMAFGEQYNYSSVTILAGCGNLYLENTSFDGLPGAKTALECAHGDWYHQRVKALIEKADHVFLASAWRQFEADLFADSWTNLTAEFGDKFFALGSIAIEYDQRSIFDSRFDALQNATYPQLPDVAAVNTTIGQVAGDRFIDPAEIFCEARRCGLFMDGDAVFYDGYHYTQHGTAILSRWLHDWAGEALM